MRCQSTDEFIARAAAGRFDVITLRFCLGLRRLARGLGSLAAFASTGRPHRTHWFRLAFRDGAQLARRLRTSGIATRPVLAALPLELANVLWDRFAVLVEAHRKGDTIPLDFTWPV